MRYQKKIHGKARRATWVALSLALVLISSKASGQQEYVTRFDMFTGYTFLDSPAISLFENGFHYQAGVRATTWVSMGFDYSISSGTLTLTPNLLTTQIQQELTTIPFPPGYNLSIPVHSRTQTITGGPQFAYRHFSKVTLFIRPSIGAILEKATPKPSDPISTAIVQTLAPSGTKSDTTIFYGFGGGADLIFSKHVALRVQSDLVWDHLFSDLLQNGRWTVRFSVGPCFNFGKNIAKAALR
jgi:hypothetical protein